MAHERASEFERLWYAALAGMKPQMQLDQPSVSNAWPDSMGSHGANHNRMHDSSCLIYLLQSTDQEQATDQEQQSIVQVAEAATSDDKPCTSNDVAPNVRDRLDQDAAELFSLATDVLIRASHLPATREHEDDEQPPSLSSDVHHLVTGQGFKACSPTDQLKRLMSLLVQVGSSDKSQNGFANLRLCAWNSGQ